MKKYYFLGGTITFAVIFNLGYVFHELVAGAFFRTHIGALQRDSYIIPLIAVAFVCYTAFQAYFLPVYIEYTTRHYKWSITKTSLIFGAIIGFVWDGLQGGIIEVATFKMPLIVFWYDSGYHTLEGILTSFLLSVFYQRFVIRSKLTQ
ncbi:MAG: hypothetical protein WDO14_06775 [Bacteroidota bacterium]